MLEDNSKPRLFDLKSPQVQSRSKEKEGSQEEKTFKELSSSLIWGENRSCFCGLWLYVFFVRHGSIVPLASGITQMTSSNHDDHDWLNPLFLDSLLSLGIVVSESPRNLALMRGFWLHRS